MNNPAENLCQANLLMTRLNAAMRDCNKENLAEVALLSASIREQLAAIRLWAMHGQDQRN